MARLPPERNVRVVRRSATHLLRENQGIFASTWSSATAKRRYTDLHQRISRDGKESQFLESFGDFLKLRCNALFASDPMCPFDVVSAPDLSIPGEAPAGTQISLCANWAPACAGATIKCHLLMRSQLRCLPLMRS